MDDKRVIKLKNYRILDTSKEEEFDQIVELASRICNAPISLISLLDLNRQWFKSTVGVDLKETIREVSFCSHTIEEETDFMAVRDLTKDERFSENPFVLNAPYVRSYAGVSLITEEGLKIGTVCILDDKPRSFTEDELENLRILSKHTINLIKIRRKNEIVKERNSTLELVNKNLEAFTYTVAHDVKAPLRTMNSFSSILLEKYKDKFSTEEAEYLTFINNSSKDLSNYTSDLLEFSKKIQISTEDYSYMDLTFLMERIVSLLNHEKEVSILYKQDHQKVFAPPKVLRQILQNLISNSIKYRDTSRTESYVKIEMKEYPNKYILTVMDNGIGISDFRKNQLFQLFKKDDRNIYSSGIGLCIVKELIEKLKGEIMVESEEGQGTTVTFSLAKL
ncbi:MAG: sensor histidine kinase [Chitinophagales bacterium]